MRLLLAEDEKALARAVTAMLEKNNYAVDTVYDGETALDYALAETYDALILDIMMPKLDGVSVLKALRAKGIQVPVLLLTAKAEVEDKILGLDSGANDYLTKPFAAGELMARIRVLTRGAEAVDSTWRVGNLDLERSSCILRSPAGSLRLPNKEFQILELLMANPGRLISTERILEKIWGFDTEAELSVVWVYMSYLRRKLHQLHADVQIKSARNTGYTLEKIDA